jgi:glutathionylspermidine synthase
LFFGEVGAAMVSRHLNLMDRIITSPRNNWQRAVEKLGFNFHTNNIPYWDESAFYSFTLSEILNIETATAELWRICIDTIQYIIDQNLFRLFQIPDEFVPYIVQTWNDEHPSIYGRFDLCFKNGQIKMLEFNADTPTSLFEAGIVQWFWLQDFDDAKDQFNSIHEKLIEQWNSIRSVMNPGILYFSCAKDTLEDLTNTEYLRDCAMQAGFRTKFLFIDDIGWDDLHNDFVDLDHETIQNLFKLYPWEFMIREEFGTTLLIKNPQLRCIEPAWKMILSNKAILPLLWKLYPNHPFLLPAYFTIDNLSSYVKKPLLSREGANIEINIDHRSYLKTEGIYGSEGYIYQSLFDLPDFCGNYPVIGSWIIGDKPAGIGIRESKTLITDNFSRFIPHLIN